MVILLLDLAKITTAADLDLVKIITVILVEDLDFLLNFWINSSVESLSDKIAWTFLVWDIGEWVSTGLEIESLIFESINISENRNKLKNIVPQPPNVVLLATGSSFQVFGSQFKLGYKILVVTVKTNIAEPNMRIYISNLSNEFFSQLMNPFYSPFSQINASSFDERVIKDALLIKASP